MKSIKCVKFTKTSPITYSFIAIKSTNVKENLINIIDAVKVTNKLFELERGFGIMEKEIKER